MKKYILLFALLFSIFISYGQMVVLGSNGNGQQISLVGNTLKLTGSPDVDLSAYLDNTDGQTVTDLSLAGNILSITLSGGNTQTVDLSAISLQDNSVTSAKIVDGTIVNADIANNAIDQNKIQDNAISSSKIVSTAVTNGKLAPNSVTGDKIVDGTIALADLSATGTKNSTTFLRGDNTFGVPLNIENSNLNIGNNQRVLDLGVTGSFKITQGASEFFTVNNSGANMIMQSDPYDSSWASLYNPASKADVYNKIETIGTAAATSYDNTTSGLTATNVKTAIDELKTNINAITGAAPLQLTASRAFTNTDLNRPLWSNTGTELSMTVNSGLGVDGDIIHMTPLATNSVIKPVSGTATLVNTFKTTSVVGQPLVYRKINGLWVTDPRDGVSYTLNVMTESNAANPDNESNTTTGWLANGGTISSAADPSIGTYAIKDTAPATTVSFIYYTINVTAGDTYTVTFDAKSTQGSLDRITGWTNCTGGPSSVNPGATYAPYSYNITATATGTIQTRFYSSASTAGVAGDNIFVDNFIITKTN